MENPRTIDHILKLVEDGIASATPDEFFHLFTRRLAEATGAAAAFVVESDADSQSATLVACWNGKGHVGGEAFDSATTPLGAGLAGRVISIGSGLTTMVREDSWVGRLNGEALVAAPLFSRGDLPLGWVGVVGTEPMPDAEGLVPILQIFAARAAGELARARLERRLSESEERYRRLVEGSPDMIFRLRLRPDLGFEYINAAAERILGYPLEELRAGDREFILNIFATEEDREDAAHVAAGTRFYPTRVRSFKRPDGSIVWAELHNVAVYDEMGAMIATEGTLRDVTAREEALRSLEEAEQSIRRLIEALPDIVVRLDDEANLIEIVQTVGMARVPREDLDRVIHVLSSADALKEVRAAARTQAPRQFVSKLAGNETDETYEFRLVPAHPGEVLALVRDISSELWAAGEDERRRAREEVEGAVERQIGIRNPYQFTFREFTVLHLVAKGASDKEIANQLGIALSTANKHVSNILGKMGAASRTEAGVRAVQEHLVSG